jgi:hypothetical protein
VGCLTRALDFGRVTESSPDFHALTRRLTRHLTHHLVLSAVVPALFVFSLLRRTVLRELLQLLLLLLLLLRQLLVLHRAIPASKRRTKLEIESLSITESLISELHKEPGTWRFDSLTASFFICCVLCSLVVLLSLEQSWAGDVWRRRQRKRRSWWLPLRLEILFGGFFSLCLVL